MFRAVSRGSSTRVGQWGDQALRGGGSKSALWMCLEPKRRAKLQIAGSVKTQLHSVTKSANTPMGRESGFARKAQTTVTDMYKVTKTRAVTGMMVAWLRPPLRSTVPRMVSSRTTTAACMSAKTRWRISARAPAKCSESRSAAA